jgi:hydroxypyruvate isomerase
VIFVILVANLFVPSVVKEHHMGRRDFLLGLVAPLVLTPTVAQAPLPRKGRIKQGVTRGVFARGMALEECCREAARLGIKGFDLIGPPEWPVLRKYGLVPSMYPLGPGGTIADALNRTENHAKLEASLRAAIDECAANQVPNISRSRATGAAWPTRKAPTTSSRS